MLPKTYFVFEASLRELNSTMWIKSVSLKSYFVHILLCSDKLTYTGVTNNISRRFQEHQKGVNKNYFTFKHRPVELIFSQEFTDINQAIYFEKNKEMECQEKISLIFYKFYQNAETRHIQNITLMQNKGLDCARQTTES